MFRDEHGVDYILLGVIYPPITPKIDKSIAAWADENWA